MREYTETVVLQAAQTGNANGGEILLAGLSTLGLQVVGSTFTGTVNFEATIDGTNWIAIQLTNVNSGAAASTATGSALFAGSVAGLLRFRARTSGVSAGNVTVTAVATAAPR